MKLFKKKCTVYGCNNRSIQKINSRMLHSGEIYIIRLCKEHYKEYEEA